jgi:hypothetical protein
MSDPQRRPTALSTGRAATLLALLAILRLALHAVAWPAWEGPDEPFHQARAEAWAARPLGPGAAEAVVPAAFVAAFAARPCGGDMARAFGCPPFDGTGALFGALRPAPPRAAARDYPNYETHQPPLWYLLAGWLLRPAVSAGASPEARLLVLRLASVLAVALALLGPIRRLAARRGAGLLGAVAVVLLLPAGAESLARASNDALVFLLVAAVVERLDRDAPGPLLLLLLAAGPLVKLTFLPVAAFAVVELARRRAFRPAVLAAAASALVVPVQALRGWAWGGTYELNRTAGALGESLGASALGFARSVYTFAKTSFWIGGWSFFRSPVLLVVAFFSLLLLAAFLLRPAAEARRLLPHAAAIGVAAAGFAVLAVGNRRLFGTWGGLGGWYAWNWLPWLAVAADDLLERRSDAARRVLLAVLAAFLVAANAAFVAAAVRLYG